MRIKMKCPFCNNEMENGNLFGDKYKLKWVSATKKLFMGIWAKDSISIDSRTSSQRFYKRTFVVGNICKNCNKIILDIPKNKKT